ncbi:eamA domain, WAT1-related protein [Artemisia annua]|uniref:EamA domain, WAT1-related protein n=1 Tax=Artemisia annua TaxID=35608 RepID=A0A2U1L6P1_ARTAN|nr:eamA domain, WAT1-related protein [Artemisia annua]
MEGKLGCFARFFLSSKPYIAMICLQFGYAGMNIITKVSLNRGMSHYVLVVYRHAFATAAIAPFAIILERNIRPKITFSLFCQMFVLGLLGPVIDQNFYYAGLKFTSPTFSCAMSNMLPAMTFVMAVLCRMEKLDLKKVRSQAKVIGTVLTVAGAMLMTLYKGNVVELIWTKHVHPHYADTSSTTTESADKEWVLGSILLIIATFAWASFFILQNVTMRRYTAPLSLTCLVCFIGTLQSIVVTFVMEHKPNAWTIGWDMNLLAAAYASWVLSSLLKRYTWEEGPNVTKDPPTKNVTAPSDGFKVLKNRGPNRKNNDKTMNFKPESTLVYRPVSTRNGVGKSKKQLNVASTSTHSGKNADSRDSGALTLNNTNMTSYANKMGPMIFDDINHVALRNSFEALNEKDKVLEKVKTSKARNDVEDVKKVKVVWKT